MKLSRKLKLLAPLFAFAVFNIQSAFAIQKMSAGITYDYLKDISNDVIYKTSFDFIGIPDMQYSDLGYFIKFKPVNMLSSSELFFKKKNKSRKTIGQNLAPSVYNISFVNNGEVDFDDNSSGVEELIRKHPDRVEYIYAYAIKLKNEQRYDEALSQIDKALSYDNNYALGHFLKGDILRISGRFKEAAREYFATLEINPYCTDAYFNIAKMLEMHGNEELALSYYKMAYVVDPNDIEIRNSILKLNKKLGMI